MDGFDVVHISLAANRDFMGLLHVSVAAVLGAVIALPASGLEIIRDVLEFTAKLWSQQNERGDDDEGHERDDERILHQALPAAASKDATEHATVLSRAVRAMLTGTTRSPLPGWHEYSGREQARQVRAYWRALGPRPPAMDHTAASGRRTWMRLAAGLRREGQRQRGGLSHVAHRGHGRDSDIEVLIADRRRRLALQRRRALRGQRHVEGRAARHAVDGQVAEHLKVDGLADGDG